jgi:hypothetical protein
MSQVEPHKTKIGDSEYTMSMLAPMRSHRLLLRVIKMVGPSLGPVFDTFFSAAKSKGKDAFEQEVPTEFFTKAAAALFGELDEKVLDDVIEALKEVTVVEGEGGGKLDRGQFDIHFLGKLEEMYQWLAWGMKVQWGKSVGALLTGAIERGAGAVTGLESLSPST